MLIKHTLGGLRHAGDELLGGRVQHVDPFGGLGLNELIVNEELSRRCLSEQTGAGMELNQHVNKRHRW